MRPIILVAIILTLIICLCIVGIVRGEETREWTGIVIHHSATEIGTVESIRKYHIEHNGWDDIGYHFLIQRDGHLSAGRSLSKVGAHAKGRNEDYIGICLVGRDEFTKNQYRCLIALIDKLGKQFRIKSIEPHHEECPGEGFDNKFFGKEGVWLE